MSAVPIRRVVIGTAGHIDHGKSTLVRALTGIDPDRLAEEKARGMTIDLGFAPWTLPTGERVGFVDVPGHERFLKNMVAGATGVDLALLVVAADDSVMPQTREHIEILDLLGVARGVVALTKIDKVDPELVPLVADDVRAALAGRSLADAPIVPVSTATGEGLDKLTAALTEAVRGTESRPAESAFRMPVQRVFSAQGSGTVLTGIPVSGSLAVGDRVEIQPGNLSGRVRALQAYGETVESVSAGHSSALNLAELDYRQVRRGLTVTAPGKFRATSLPVGRLRLLAGGPALTSRRRIRFHLGTAELLGTLTLLDARRLEPGASCLAQFELESEVVAHPGDRYVVRDESAGRTLGGGVIVEASRRRLRPHREPVLAALAKAEIALVPRATLAGPMVADPMARLEVILAAAGTGPGVGALDLAEVLRDLALPEAEEEHLLALAHRQGRAVHIPSPPRLVSGEVLEGVAQRIMAALAAHFAEHPLRALCERGELLARLQDPPELVDAALAKLAVLRKVEQSGQGFRPAERKLGLSEEDGLELSRLEARLREAGLAPPSPEEGAADPARAKRLAKLLVEQGKLVRAGELLFHAQAVDEARRKVLDALAREPLTTSRLRELLGTSRKYAIPLLELFDNQGWTARQGDLRKPGPQTKK